LSIWFKNLVFIEFYVFKQIDFLHISTCFFSQILLNICLFRLHYLNVSSRFELKILFKFRIFSSILQESFDSWILQFGLSLLVLGKVIIIKLLKLSLLNKFSFFFLKLGIQSLLFFTHFNISNLSCSYLWMFLFLFLSIFLFVIVLLLNF